MDKNKNDTLPLIKFSKNPLFLLTLITIGITIYLLAKQIYIGVPYYDVFVYLNNALTFSGIPVGSVMYLSPLIPFLTSLFFRAGYISSNAIFIVDAIIFVFGVIGFYLLLKQRFNTLESFAGSLIFISFPLIFTWAVSGSIDVPGISFSIWAIYFLIRGVKNDSKYILIVFPMVAVAFLARYTSAAILFPVVLYLLINGNLWENIKKSFLSILAVLALIIPVLSYMSFKFGTLTPIITLFISNISGFGTGITDLSYNPDKLYFLKNMLNYLSVGPIKGPYVAMQNPSQGEPSILSYILVPIVLIGLSIYIYTILKKKIENINKSNLKKNFLYGLLLIVLVIVCLLSLDTNLFIVSEIIAFMAIFVGYQFLKDTHIKNLEIDFLFLSWFLAFLIFHSMLPVKVDRYLITMVPPLAYFIILGLTVFLNKLDLKLKKEHLKPGLICLIIGLMILSSTTVTHIGHSEKRGYVHYMTLACDQLTMYDPHYQEKIIYSDYNPAVTWILKKEVNFGVPRLYGSPEKFSIFLKNANATYYIDALTDPKVEIDGYHRIPAQDEVAIYEKD